MRTRTGRYRRAVLAVYLVLVIVTVALLGSRVASPHEHPSPVSPVSSATDAEG